MAQVKNPWEMSAAELAAAARSTRSVIGGPIPGGTTIVTGPADPAYASKAAIAAAEVLKAQAQGRNANAQQAADTRIKNAQADELERKNRDAAAANRPLDPSLDNLTGPAFTQKLPQATQATVQALVEGRMGFPSGAALRSPYWQQMIQYVAHADPSFDAVNFGARSKARSDFTSGKSAQNIRALNTAIGHLGTLNDQISGTASHDFTPYNAASNYVVDKFGGAGPGKFEQTAGALASELTQVFRGSGGAEADIKRELGHLSADGSLEQKKSAVQNIATLLKSRLDALGDQYTQGMGTTAQPLSLLNSHAKQAYAVLSGLGVGGDPTGSAGGGGSPASGGGPRPVVIGGVPSVPPGGGSGGGSLSAGPSQGGPPMVLATGSTKAVDTSKVNGVIDAMIRKGATDDQISAAIAPLGFAAVNPDQTRAARRYLAKNPGYAGSFGGARSTAPTSAWERVKSNPIAQSVGTAALGFGDAATLGLSDEGAGVVKSLFTGRPVSEEIAGLNADKQAAFANNPVSAFVGQTAGTIAGMEAAGGRLAAIARSLRVPGVVAPAAADVAFGTASGAGQDNNDRISGGIIGGIGAVGGNVLGYGAGKGVGAIARTASGQRVVDAIGDSAVGRMAGFTPPTPAPALSAAERTVAGAATKAGPDGILAQLSEAQNFGVPMSLADTSPELRELAGAAVRRSPTASSFAEDNLIPRNRGQYDRFTAAVDQNLGPTANIPQRSADLTAQARAAAGPLYDKAYAAPVISTPELDATLNTPFGRQALSRANTIAANERRNPTELGFVKDTDGNFALNSQPQQALANHLAARDELDAAQDAYRLAKGIPGADMSIATGRVEAARQNLRDAAMRLDASPDPTLPMNGPAFTTQSLDYVKRGMDDVLEDQRNPLTGKLVLDEAGRAQNGVRQQFLSEVDRINPAYADARAAYAGPASVRSNMAAGQDAYTANPQQLAVDVAGSSPDRLGQMQLGYQGALVDHAGRVRDASNPFEATLGSPIARDRLTAMYPDGGPVPGGIPNLLRQRELEGGMQATSNAILGNSRTARNQIADEAFSSGALPAAAIDAGVMAIGGIPTASIGRALASSKLRDVLTLGGAARAVAKADDIAPILLTPDPAASGGRLGDILSRLQARQAYVDATTPTSPLSTAGAAFGTNALLAPLTYRANPSG